MSDSRPIGIFDSGLGGLTVAKEIYRTLPHESTIYIGDTARVPYGNRSPETIANFSHQMVEFLLEKNVKAIVIACATASSVALETLQEEYQEIPIIGVIKPAAKKAMDTTVTRNVGILATRATVKSQSFARAMQIFSKLAVRVQAVACPLFVPIIEEGIIAGPIIESVAHLYLEQLRQEFPDTIILGCTHYPLITAVLQKLLPTVTLINVGIPTATELSIILKDTNRAAPIANPTHEYYATDINDNFSKTANLFLGSSISIQPYHLKD